ncbi:hypothetical protein HHL17_02130 [Chitinophaga sp. G-6-1-13]|uniref:GLPGLI family protein n=1 Tax=Chitinophaga fulva TaxID=2728842 RepID=A0A848GBV9_9BACT|nr:hypothetical protein [Chitinophaga fulva]NML35984.1 hypothetical protein [Chitinophaga fulva]
MKWLLSLLCTVLLGLTVKAQTYVYPNVVTYHTNKYAAYGSKIKTNIAFVNGDHMPTIIIEGYNYGTGEPIGLVINFYIYDNVFMRYNVSSFGSYTPPVYLANEGGKVVLFLENKDYYQRFAVRAFAKGQNDLDPDYTGWTVTDEPISPAALNKTLITYQNRFAGQVILPGNSIWNDVGVGIGTKSIGTSKLAVEGTISARKVKVTQANPWPDYVFHPGYSPMSLEETEAFIRTHQHLPEIPSAAEVAADGIDLGEMNRQLLKKPEEMTLHMIDMKKQIKALEARLPKQ